MKGISRKEKVSSLKKYKTVFREKNVNNSRETGITLIALVITVIVLLILAAVSISTLTGENGILTRVDEARTQTEIGEEIEKIELSATGALAKDNGGIIIEKYLEDELSSYIGKRNIDYQLTGTGPFVVKYLDSGRSYIVEEDGNVNEYIDIVKYVEIGDYVEYNPTVSDKKGTLLEQTKLTYTSYRGNAIEHGNGYASSEEEGQTFTANSDIKWKIFSVENGVVELISENVVTTTSNSNFIINGAIGYLYAEQELNEICKIFGYGYGADTTKGGTYTIGGPLDELITKKVKNTGERSITIEKKKKKAGITEEDYPNLNSNYGKSDNPTVGVYYPTINITNGNSNTGKSNTAGAKNLKYTHYRYDESKIANKEEADLLFSGNYWLASRSVYTYTNDTRFYLRFVLNEDTSASTLCRGTTDELEEFSDNHYGVRPIVTLKLNTIDITTDYEKEGHWNLK